MQGFRDDSPEAVSTFGTGYIRTSAQEAGDALQATIDGQGFRCCGYLALPNLAILLSNIIVSGAIVTLPQASGEQNLTLTVPIQWHLGGADFPFDTTIASLYGASSSCAYPDPIDCDFPGSLLYQFVGSGVGMETVHLHSYEQGGGRFYTYDSSDVSYEFPGAVESAAVGFGLYCRWLLSSKTRANVAPGDGLAEIEETFTTGAGNPNAPGRKRKAPSISKPRWIMRTVIHRKATPQRIYPQKTQPFSARKGSKHTHAIPMVAVRSPHTSSA